MFGSASPIRWLVAPSSTGTGKSCGSSMMLRITAISSLPVWQSQPTGPILSLRRVRDEFHERAVGIAEIDARARTLGAEPLHRPALDRDTAAAEMRDRIG